MFLSLSARRRHLAAWQQFSSKEPLAEYRSVLPLVSSKSRKETVLEHVEGFWAICFPCCAFFARFLSGLYIDAHFERNPQVMGTWSD
jgi:hypothetical protein